jgi:hypothetical protein
LRGSKKIILFVNQKMSEEAAASSATDTTATTNAPPPPTTTTATKVAFDEADLVAKTHKMFTELAKYVKGELTSEP